MGGGCMKKLFILSVLVCGITLVASDAKRSRCVSPSLLDDGELTLGWLQDQCIWLLTDIRKVGYTRYTEEDIDALKTIEEAEALAETLDLAYVAARKKNEIKKKASVTNR